MTAAVPDAVRRLSAKRWEVTRQQHHGGVVTDHTVSVHRFQAVADLHRWWQDRCQQRRSRRSVEVGIREISVHYNVLPAPEPTPEPNAEQEAEQEAETS